MIFKTQYNKFSKLYQENSKNNIDVENLPIINIVGKDITINKKHQEIILCENYFYRATAYLHEYIFENLESNHLHYLQPSVLFTTTDGFNFDALDYGNKYWWEMRGTSYVFKLRTGCIILTYQNEQWTSHIAPVFLTAKITVHNPRLFELITTQR